MFNRISRSMIADPDTFISSSGDRVRPLFELGLDKDKRKILVQTGSVDIPDFINAFQATTDMAFILARLSAGDVSVLNRKPCFYCDSTILPKTPAEGYDMIDQSIRAFDALPDDVRAKFNNNVLDWLASAGSPDWISKMARVPAPVSPDSSESEVSA